MDRNPLLKYMMKDKKEDVVHSSGYAEAQNAGKIGAASAESFAKRQAMEASRTAVQGYKSSGLVGDAFGNTGMKAKSYNASKDALQRAAVREKFGGERESGTGGEHGGSGAVTQSQESAVGQRGSLNDRFAMPVRGENAGRPPARRNPGISR